MIVNSRFRNNRAGIVPNSGSYELCYPERKTTIVGNIVHDNNQADTPAIDVALLAMGNGILSAGGVANVDRAQPVYGPRQDRHRPRAVPRGGRQRRQSRRRTSGPRRARPRNEPRSTTGDVRVRAVGATRQQVVGNVRRGLPASPTSPSATSAERPVDARQLLQRQRVHHVVRRPTSSARPVRGRRARATATTAHLDSTWCRGSTRPTGSAGGRPTKADCRAPQPQENMPDAANAPADPATDMPASGRPRRHRRARASPAGSTTPPASPSARRRRSPWPRAAARRPPVLGGRASSRRRDGAQRRRRRRRR